LSPFLPGDHVIYRMPKRSTHPGPRAKEVRPSPHGENSPYYVDKFWTATAVGPNGDVVARTRREKRRVLRADDPALRRATWLDRLLHGSRFPGLQ